MKAEEVIRRLRLAPHPEGGFYREIYRAPGEGRTAATSIYFLLEAGPSRWHRVDAPEIWVWHAGAPLVLETETDRAVLGPLEEGGAFQAVVPARKWQRCRSLGAWSLAGCIVAPAFTFDGFEIAPPGWEPPGAPRSEGLPRQQSGGSWSSTARRR